MASRLALHEVLCDILGARNVYFQPPETVKMTYPAIVYGLENIKNLFADDGIHFSKRQYQVTVIDKDPDSEITEKIVLLPLCRFSRHFEKDNLNHDVFTLYF